MLVLLQRVGDRYRRVRQSISATHVLDAKKVTAGDQPFAIFCSPAACLQDWNSCSFSYPASWSQQATTPLGGYCPLCFKLGMHKDKHTSVKDSAIQST